MSRKRRPGEIVCRCAVYTFPHRMMGGRCNGGAYVDSTWEEKQYTDCRDCIHYEVDEVEGLRCKVLHGGEAIMECPALVEHVRYEGIKLYGVNAPPQKGPLRFRR
jgi:hypothetical protein